MKLAIIGAGGLRTPLMIHQLAESGTCTAGDEVVLYDTDTARLATVEYLCRIALKKIGGTYRLRIAETPEEAISGCDYMLLTIRAGGEQGRIKDERIALELGMLGQENTGPGGFSMALRNIPAAIEYARMAERLAPDAWIINFTNPAGIITRALLTQTKMRTIGICDTPSALGRQIARHFGVGDTEVQMEYFGLNHLGWIRKVLVGSEDVSAKVRTDLPEILGREMFNPEILDALELIPNEYLYFYYHRDRALGNILKSDRTRGEDVMEQTAQLLATIRQLEAEGKEAEAFATYERYIEHRDASYMSIETGRKVSKGIHMADGGYAGVAINLIQALSGGPSTVVIADFVNNGAIDRLRDDDIVEGNCIVNSNGIFPLRCGPLPYQCEGLLLSGAAYERATVEAAISGTRSAVLRALMLHPLGIGYETAKQLTDRYLDAHRQDLPQFAAVQLS